MSSTYDFLPGNPDNKNISRPTSFNKSINSMGYRAPEFNTINWKESIVIFGCSHVFGKGVVDEDTISYKLEKLINRPVINMGVPASSTAFALLNQLKMHEQKIKPYAVINLWTCFRRLTYFHDKNILHLGPWSDRNNESDLGHIFLQKMFGLWNYNDYNAKEYTSIFYKLSNIIWEDTIKLDYSFFKDTANLLNIKHIKGIDPGLDGEHFGALTSIETANIIKEDLWSHLSDSN